MYQVYALCDPRNGKLRYVGLSENLPNRFRDHWEGGSTGQTMRNWLCELRDAGTKPLMLVLCEHADWQQASYMERNLINYYPGLLNRQDRDKALARVNARPQPTTDDH